MADDAKRTSRESDDCDDLCFETALEQLELVVRKLEEGQLGLSDALEAYETGVRHLKQCYQALESAERRIELLTGVDAAGNPITQPFDDQQQPLEEKAGSRSRRRPTRAGRLAPAQSELAEDVDDSPGLF